jgi:predicted DsbA family dithiol-disulfide isomerase
VNALTPIVRRQTVEVVYDFVCPWCYLGTRRLFMALAQRPAELFEIVWRPFLLNPDIPREGLSRQDYVARKYGGEDRARRLYASVGALGVQSGITFRFDRIHHVPSSIDAHRLAGWAVPFGVASALVEALFAAHFVEGADLGDVETLVGIAARTGLDPDAARLMLRGREGLESVQSENLRAHRRGIGGVPCFVFGGKLAVSGAQETEVFQRLLDVAALEPVAA